MCEARVRAPPSPRHRKDHPCPPHRSPARGERAGQRVRRRPTDGGPRFRWEHQSTYPRDESQKVRARRTQGHSTGGNQQAGGVAPAWWQTAKPGDGHHRTDRFLRTRSTEFCERGPLRPSRRPSYSGPPARGPLSGGQQDGRRSRGGRSEPWPTDLTPARCRSPLGAWHTVTESGRRLSNLNPGGPVERIRASGYPS